MKLLRQIANLGYGSRREVQGMFADGRITDADAPHLGEDENLAYVSESVITRQTLECGDRESCWNVADKAQQDHRVGILERSPV